MVPPAHSLTSAAARRAPAIASSGASPFSWRVEASVRSPRAREVARMFTPSQPADSMTTSVVVSVTPDSSPPMTPPMATGPAASATTSIEGVSLRVCPSRQRIDSPSRARRTRSRRPSSLARSKT